MKRILSFLLFAVLGVQAYSQTVGKEIAQTIAEHFFLQNYGLKKAVLEILVKEYNGHESLFFCNMEDGGWVAVPANRNLNPVVAHSDEGSIELGEGPDVFWDWMEQYEYVADVAFKENWNKEEKYQKWDKLLDGDSYHLKSYVNNTYLIQSKWGQSITNDSCYFALGYNSLIPVNSSCENGRCPAGCGAVAIAQIANYWGYSQGDYVDFDWWNMPDSLLTTRANYINNQKAVSYMLSRIGSHSNTIYCNGGCESSATTNDIVAGLIALGYKNDIQTYQKKWHTLYNTWVGYLSDEIENERPVLYMYMSPSGIGHAFVCDGYNSGNDNLHFNLGWNGNYDCWSDFEDLFEPNHVSIIDNGGTHYCLVNIRPDVEQDLSLTNVTVCTTGTVATNKTYQTKGSISVAGEGSSFTVQDSSSCRFVSKDSIVLKPGFHAQKGTSLLCRIFKRSTLNSYNMYSDMGSSSTDTEYLKSDDFLVFPNPSQDNFTIRLNNPEHNIIPIRILNIFGETLESFSADSNEFTLCLKEYPMGIYYIVVKQNDIIYSKTILKQ